MKRHANKVQRDPVLSPAGTLRGCSGKRQYATFVEARRLAVRVRRQKEDAVEAYHCRHCHHFHLGAPERRPDKRRTAQP